MSFSFSQIIVIQEGLGMLLDPQYPVNPLWEVIWMDLGADLDIAHQVEEVLRINFIQMVVDHLEVGVAYLEGEGEDEGDFQGVRHIT